MLPDSHSSLPFGGTKSITADAKILPFTRIHSLLPEGVLLDQMLIKHKLDRGDKWGQLIALGLDLTGFVSVLPASGDQKPIGKVTPGQKATKRTAIHPGDDALPYTVTELDGRKTGFDRALLIDYFGREICGLNDRMIEKTTQALQSARWDLSIHGSKLSVDDSVKYLQLVRERMEILKLT